MELTNYLVIHLGQLRRMPRTPAHKSVQKLLIRCL